MLTFTVIDKFHKKRFSTKNFTNRDVTERDVKGGEEKIREF